MAAKFLLVSTIIFSLAAFCQAAVPKVLFIRDTKYDDTIDDNYILQVTNNTTLLRCSRQCQGNTNCVGFFMNTAERMCQEQTALSNVSDVSQRPGTNYYHKDNIIAANFTCPVQGGGWSMPFMLPDGQLYEFQVFNDITLNYTESVSLCSQHGGQLPRVLTKAMLDFYRMNIFPCPDLYDLNFFMDGTNYGAIANGTTFPYKTQDGMEILFTQELWAKNRPNRPTTSNCIESRRKTFDHKFNDVLCDSELSVLCQK